jgi:GTPase SAR1 family protein
MDEYTIILVGPYNSGKSKAIQSLTSDKMKVDYEGIEYDDYGYAYDCFKAKTTRSILRIRIIEVNGFLSHFEGIKGVIFYNMISKNSKIAQSYKNGYPCACMYDYKNNMGDSLMALLRMIRDDELEWCKDLDVYKE